MIAYHRNSNYSISISIILISILMKLMDYEENYEEDIQADSKLQEFTKKALVIRTIDQLNKSHQNRIPCPDSNNSTAQRRIIKQSSEVWQNSTIPLKKHHLSLDQGLVNKFSQQLNNPAQPPSSFRNGRKKLTIEKRLMKGDLRDGDGVARLSNGETIFATWKNGDACGEVKIVYPSGSIYIGRVKNYVRHGFGVFVFKSGNRFEGEFIEGRIDGYGALTDSQGEVVQRGIWKNGCLIQRAQ